jgi:hypothetical protein
MSQLLFSDQSNFTNYAEYNQTLILNDKNEIDPDLLKAYGLPNLTITYLSYLITTGVGTTAAIVHLCLWNWHDVKYGFAWAKPENLKKLINPATYRFWDPTPQEEILRRAEQDPEVDPHRLIILRNYKDAPDWWYLTILAVSFIVGMICIYTMDTTLPWWGLVVALISTSIFFVFFGVQHGMHISPG